MQKSKGGLSNPGFSLIEVIIALGIALILAGDVVLIFTSGVKWMDKCRDVTAVQLFIQEKLEEKLSATSWPPTAESRATITGFTRYERAVVVEDLTNPNIKVIRVTVWYPGGSEEYATLVSNF